MGVIKGSSKVKSALCNHSWGYSQEGSFDAAHMLGLCLVSHVTDRADGGNHQHIYADVTLSAMISIINLHQNVLYFWFLPDFLFTS